jgi:hypothetical protein
LGHGAEVGPAASGNFLVAPDWVCDPDMAKASEVEIRFTAEGPSATLVELEHSKLERHGEGYERLREMFDGPTAWAGILELYTKKVAGQ